MIEIPGRPSQEQIIERLSIDLFLGDFVTEGSLLTEEGLCSKGFVPLIEIIESYFPQYTEEQHDRIQGQILGRYYSLKGGCDMSTWDEIDLNQNPTDSI